jgi:hypothetical protein
MGSKNHAGGQHILLFIHAHVALLFLLLLFLLVVAIY